MSTPPRAGAKNTTSKENIMTTDPYAAAARVLGVPLDEAAARMSWPALLAAKQRLADDVEAAKFLRIAPTDAHGTLGVYFDEGGLDR